MMGSYFDAVRVQLIEIGEAVEAIPLTCLPANPISRGPT